MQLPDLLPDLTFPRLPNTGEARDYAFELKRAALGPHISSRWGWDESFQRDAHNRRFAEKPFFAIVRCKQPVGTLSLRTHADHLRFGEFYLHPEAQRRGVGTEILSHLLFMADEIGLPVRLEFLYWNPVGSLYRRFDFIEVGRSDTHVFMERPPSSPLDDPRGAPRSR